MTDAAELYRLIAQGEHQEQDFKYEISSISKIARSLSAFANTDGGRLLVGGERQRQDCRGTNGRGILHDRIRCLKLLYAVG